MLEHALRPGMRLMRRLGISGKFGAIFVLLLLPLCISMVSSFQESTGQISFAGRERDGLVYVEPLVHLTITLSQARNAAVEGRRPEAGWLSVVREVDDANALYGEDFAVSGDWTSLRRDVSDVFDDSRPLSTLDYRAGLTAKRVQQLIKKVADSSNLILDPELDSYYTMIMLVDRLPHLVLAASDLHALTARSGSTGSGSTGSGSTGSGSTGSGSTGSGSTGSGTATIGSSGTDLATGIAVNDLRDTARQLALDQTTAVAATSWSGLRQQVATETLNLTSAVASYAASAAATEGQSGPTTDAVRTAAVDEVASAAASLGRVLSTSLDELLALREQRLMAERTRPLWLTLAALVVAFYLLMALSRATTRDVRAVLAEISTVTTGGVFESAQLTGRDEFAQMSRAVVYARDRLTALVGTLKLQATHDALTALSNRTLFTEKVGEAIDGGGKAVVLVINLDGFKDVNDSFGHDMGDRLLRTVGARLHRSAPRRSVVARLGGDEFAVLITEHRDTTEVTLARLQQALGEPVDIDGRQMRVQAGIGVAETTGGELTAVELIRNADVALNVAKSRGKGVLVAFEPSMHDATRERTELSADLVQAIEKGELHVLYQPIVDLQTGTLHGVESLVRWNHPTRGQISPTVFVPLAEATGLIVPMGRWVLEQACRQLAAWQRDFPDGYPLTVDVNLSTEQLNERDLVGDVLALVEETGIDATALVLEITESALADDIDTAQRRLGQLAAVGLQIALDDFGTGYSSLSYLRRLPVRILKVDKSFVSDEDPQGQALLRSIVDLGTHQGMQIIAEGVERPDQATRLRSAGCHLGQGYLWAKPLTAEEITAVLTRGGRMPAEGWTPEGRPDVTSASTSGPTAAAAPVTAGLIPSPRRSARHRAEGPAA